MSGNDRKRRLPYIEGWIARAGAVAAAVVSIAAAVAVLVPDGDPPARAPAQMAAKFDEPLIDLNASPREFKARQLRAQASPPIYAAYVQALDGTADGQAAPVPQENQPSPPEDSENGEEPIDPDALDGDGSVENPPADGEVPLDSVLPTDEDAKTYAADLGLDQDIPVDERLTAGALRDQLGPQSLPPGCRYELLDESLVLSCDGENPFTELARGLTLSEDLDAPAADEPASAQAMLTILRGTRTRPVPAAAGLSDRSQTEPVGVIVSVALTLVGLEDEDVSVYWSLYHAHDGRQVPREWLANRRADTTHAEAASDRRYSTFWVPLPRLHGPFYLRLSAVTEDGTTLDYRNTQRFD